MDLLLLGEGGKLLYYICKSYCIGALHMQGISPIIQGISLIDKGITIAKEYICTRFS